MIHMFAVWNFSTMFSKYIKLWYRCDTLWGMGRTFRWNITLNGAERRWMFGLDLASQHISSSPNLVNACCLRLSPLSFKQINQDSNSASYLGIKKLATAHRSYWYKTSHTCRFTSYNMLCNLSHATSHFFNRSTISLREKKKQTASVRSSMVLSLISRLESCPGISKSFPGMFRMVGYIWLSISRIPGTVRSVSSQDDQDDINYPK